MRLTRLQSITLEDDHGGTRACLWEKDNPPPCRVPISDEQARALGAHLGHAVACVVVPADGGGFDGYDLEQVHAAAAARNLGSVDDAYELAMDLLRWCADPATTMRQLREDA